MKLKHFVFVMVLSVIGFVQINGQGKSSESNRTIVYDYYADYTATLDIICEGVLVDQVSASFFTLLGRDHFKDGQFISGNYSLNNFVFTSNFTGEVFVIHGFLEKFMFEAGRDEMHFNLIGNQGNQYIVHVVYNLDPWFLVESHCSCH